MKMDLQEAVRFIPFGASQLLYWTTFLPASEPCLLALVIKCLPVLSLIFYIYSSPEVADDKSTHKKIMFGLVFGVCGDALLVYNDFFIFGMLAFGVGHMFYMSAFQMGKRLNPVVGLFLFSLLVGACYVLLPHIDDEKIFFGVPIYGALLLALVWCAISRAETKIQALSAVGAATFAISDLIIVINLFYQPLQYSQVYIMATYYAAQFAITLSASEVIVESKLKQKKAF